MLASITEGVKVSVATQFRPDMSKVSEALYFFNYRIEIENRNDFAVKLLTRHWLIFDSLNEVRSVSGEGVIGEQPILEPGEVFSYVSGCDLTSEVGNMSGNYVFTTLDSDIHFAVEVPTFPLIYPGRNN